MDTFTPAVSEIQEALVERFPSVHLREGVFSENDYFNKLFNIGHLSVRFYVQSGTWVDQYQFSIHAEPLHKAGPLVLLWFQSGGSWPEALQALDALREELLGLSHGLQHACGRRR